MTGGMSVRAMEWLEGRGLDVELCDRLGLASQGAGGDELLVYPCVRDGRLARKKYRRLTPEEGKQRFFADKGGATCCFNEDVLRDPGLLLTPLIITEGYEDCIVALQSGFPRALSIPDGAPEFPVDDPGSSKKYEWIAACADLLGVKRVGEIILAVDGDSAGAALQHDLALLLGKTRCKFVIYPKAKDPDRRGRERLKDLNEVLEDYGVRGVQQVITKAQWIKVNGVYAMSELPPLPDSIIYRVKDQGLEALDEHLRIRLGDVSVWTGVPSHGKSTALNDIMCRIIKGYGIRVGWASFEQEPQRDHRRALRSWYCEEYEPKLSWQDRQAADEWIDAHHRFLVPDEDEDPTLEWLIEKMEVAVVQHGCKVLIVDPWNEAVHERAPGESETDYTNRSLRTLKRFAKRFGVHIAIVAHPTKLKRNDDGTYPVPSLYDISGSAAWYNKPEQGIIVHRRTQDETIFKVQKSRYHEELGTPGVVALAYVKQTRRYTEIERGLSDDEPKKGRRRAQ